MTTFAADHDTSKALRELEERTRDAWQDYRVSLTELSGAEYEAAELVSWGRLQQALQELADERERVVAPTTGEG
jgi:signal transduction histidine kinase